MPATPEALPSRIKSPFAGRPLVRPMPPRTVSEMPPNTTPKKESSPVENVTRRVERLALEDMDEEERRIHEAAQEEASELVWKHRNPVAAEMEIGKPYVNPELGNGKKECRKTFHGSYGALKSAVKDDIATAARRSSSGYKRIMSGEKSKMFMKPEDRIWEDEPAEIVLKPKVEEAPMEEPKKPAITPVQPPSYARRNPFARARMQADRLPHSSSAPVLPIASSGSSRFDRVEIQRNPPSQSRNAGYTYNSTSHLPSLEVETKDGKELRGRDIRDATSKQRRDRSPNLPQPSMVSDRPGRPIVSFDRDWKPKEESPKRPPIPIICVPDEPPSIPTIQVDDSTPSIQITTDPSPPVPTICLPDEEPQPPKGGPTTRPRPIHAHTTGALKSTPHTTPWISSSSSIHCASCSEPIAGRILSAADHRFHPSCFVCHQCGTNLELVAFYPEPQPNDEASLPSPPKFFCHLDYHELFSPRCKSCKTPIEKHAIVACGAHWHEGHFFCAQCGDPFDATTPFVEKDGYAWCVNCHTNRYSPKCRRCRKPVTEMVVQALGAEWHSECFVCEECKSPFEDERFFIRGEGVVCVKCEERRLKA
ncbi:hypothetical protein K470DRAFT_212000 [Piedraia hortae CBS 480.64]|uniref:LIM zinc-binding domain-containing protein n=1 Tax=Piedraia hortae CBS 480.64 TaxID=1314780 RepID=A0A6A7C5I3_9PEZI|nr:hypothetical protein K470DRAFT_212000 [Piedraia hortae CBS 480.64]